MEYSTSRRQILRVEDLPGDVTLEIYFASWFFLASVYADEPLKLVQEEFHCACPQKPVVKPQSRDYRNKIFFDKFYELMIFWVM